MSTGAIIAIVIGAILLVALIALVARAAGQRRLERRREAAGEQRDQARTRAIQAESARATSDERAARAQRAEAEAEEKAAQARREGAVAQQSSAEAERQSEAARAHHDRARRLDPDISDTGEEEAREIDDSVRGDKTREATSESDAGSEQPLKSGS